MGDNPDDERSITANFTLDTEPSTTYSLTTIVKPGSGGSVEVEPSVNEEVTLLAVAQPGYIFSHWMGDVSDQDSASTTVTINSDKTVIAIFNVTLTTNCSPAEGGSITLSPAQSADGYTAGTKVYAVATAAKGYRFISWEGDASGSAISTEVTADAPTSITARFEKLPGPSLISSLWWVWMIVGIFSSVGLVILLILRRRASQT